MMCLTLLRAVSMYCVVLLTSGTSGQGEGNSYFANVKLDNSSDQLALSYKENGTWLPVCGDNWNEANSAVVCRQLGMSYNIFSTIPANFVKFSPYSWYCSGLEEDISHCFRVRAFSTCDHHQLVVLTCRDEVPALAGSVLTTYDLNHGFLLMTEYSNIKWAICAENSLDKELLVKMLSVTCTQLGYRSLSTFDLVSKATLPTSLKTIKCLPSIWLCYGNEENLAECKWIPRISVTWRLYVDCSYSDKPVDGDIRLVGGNQFVGYIEVFYNSTWGRFCHYSDSYTLQKAACRQLHLGPPIDKHFTYSNRLFGWIHDYCFECSGQETELRKCQKNHNLLPCTLDHLAFVSCLPPIKTEPRIRLVYEDVLKNPLGKAQIRLHYRWSNVIGGPNWGLKEAMVICRMLNQGLPVPAIRYESRQITSTKQSVKVKISCKGHESSLMECDNRFSQGDITTDDVIFVQCAPLSSKECDVTLVDQSQKAEEKFVFLFDNNRWRPLCGDPRVWNRSSAQRVCKHQGHAVGVPYSSSESFLGVYGMPISSECSGFWELSSAHQISRNRRQPCSKMAMVSCSSATVSYIEPRYNARAVLIFVSVSISIVLIFVTFAFLVRFMKRTHFVGHVRNPPTSSISEDSPATFALSSSSVKYSNDPPPSYNEFTANPHIYPLPTIESGHAVAEEPPAYPGCPVSVDGGNQEIEATYV